MDLHEFQYKYITPGIIDIVEYIGSAINFIQI